MAEKLIKGLAYHGNRMLSHVREDMQDMALSGFNTVLHMFTHNDWDRHRNIMKEIFAISADYGLDVWVDNWGLGGPPGDKSHFLAYHPEAHRYGSNGAMEPVYACYNAPSFVQFSKDWIDTVHEAGAGKIFWDEPHYTDRYENGQRIWTCRCECCRKLFYEQYGREMPAELTEEVDLFRKESISRYFETVCGYAAAQGMYNSTCVMLPGGENAPNYGVDLTSICDTPGLHNIGCDPYWLGAYHGYEEVYAYVYAMTRQNLDICARHKKDHNIWMQTFSNPPDNDDEIAAAADAIYDAGGRTIFAWGYRGSEANDYRAKAPDRTWYAAKSAFERITQRHQDQLRAAARRKDGLE